MDRSSSSKGSVRRKGKEVVVEALHHASSKGRSSHLLHLRRSHSSRRAAVSEHSGREARARMVHEEEVEEAHQALHREATRSLMVQTAGLSHAIRTDR